MRPILEALAYLHSQQQPSIHRDIKDANLRLTDAQAVVRTRGLASPRFNVPTTTQPMKQQYLPLVSQGGRFQISTVRTSELYRVVHSVS